MHRKHQMATSTHSRTHVYLCSCVFCVATLHMWIFIDDLVRTRNHCIRKMNLANGRETFLTWSFRFAKVYTYWTTLPVYSPQHGLYIHMKVLTFILPTCILHKQTHTHTYERDNYRQCLISSKFCSSASTDLRDEERKREHSFDWTMNPYTTQHTLHKYKCTYHTHTCKTVGPSWSSNNVPNNNRVEMLPNRTKFTNESHVIVTATQCCLFMNRKSDSNSHTHTHSH